MYQTHGAALVAYARSCGLDHGSAQDVVQQLFLKLLGAAAFIPQSPLPYLYRAARNAAFNLRRNRERETALPSSAPWLIHSGDDREAALHLHQALLELPEEQREAVFLKIWSGMTLAEIAEVTETPPNTVASRYRYALLKLRERLGKKY